MKQLNKELFYFELLNSKVILYKETI